MAPRKDSGRRGSDPAAHGSSSHGPSSGGRSSELSVLAIDHSKSMGTSDYPPSRLKAAVGAAEAFMQVKQEAFANDRVGVVVFHREATEVMPPTVATDAVKTWKKACRKVKPFDGTRLEAGLRAAAEMLERHGEGTTGTRRIVLLTDGHGGDPIAFADELKRQGVVIDVIGIGGSPEDVVEPILKEVASVVGTDLRYRFIADAASLFEHFKRIATGLVK